MKGQTQATLFLSTSFFLNFMIFYFTQVSIFHHTLGTKVDITCHYLSAQHGISFPSILIQNATSIRLSLQHYRNVSNRLLNSNSQAQYISSIQVSKMCVVLGSQFLPFLYEVTRSIPLEDERLIRNHHVRPHPPSRPSSLRCPK